MTIARLAISLDAPAYFISRVINHHFGKRFPELLHFYRIQEAQAPLGDPERQHLSIESIAYDCGFNSLSAFYSAFKKLNGLTPAEYRKQAVTTD